MNRPGLAGGEGVARLRVSLLGPVRAAWADGRGIPLPGRKARALLGFLLLARGRPVSRARLAALLWERSGDAEARASLRQALLELTRAFSGTPPFRREGDSLLADLAGCEVDALSLADGQAAPQGEMPPLLEGMDGTGEAFDEWLAAERASFLSRLRDRQEAHLLALSADPAQRDAAVEAARRLVALDPTHEPGWRLLMTLLAEGGNRAQALAEYERCEATLRRLLELEPSAETRSLASRLRAMPARPAILPPPAILPVEDGPLRVGVLPAPAPGGGEPHPLADAYAHEAALALLRYRHFEVLPPPMLDGAGGRSMEVLRASRLAYLVTTAIRQDEGRAVLILSLLDLSGFPRPIWSARAPLDEVRGMVDEEALGGLVGRLEPIILHTEGTRPVPRRSTDAGEIVLRAMPLMFSMDAARFHRAGEMLADAVTREPENAMAAAWAAQWHVFQIGQSWAPDPQAALEEAERLAVLAMSLDPESAEAAAIYGHVSSFLHKDFDSAAYYLGRSLELNPHQASSWALSAATQAYSGDPAEALRQLERYRSLAPCHPHDRILGQVFTTAYTLGGEFEKALTFGRRAVRAAPGFVNGYKPMLVALGHLGMSREARPVIEALLRVEPGFNVTDFVEAYPFRRPEDREAYAEGLRLAGAPKG